MNSTRTTTTTLVQQVEGNRHPNPSVTNGKRCGEDVNVNKSDDVDRDGDEKVKFTTSVQVTSWLVEFGACVCAWIVFLTVVIPGVIVIFGPLYLIKYHVIVPLAMKLHPEFLSPMNPYDGILAQDDFYGSRSYTNISQVLIVDGKVDIDKLCREFKKNVLEARNPQGERIYKRMRQVPVHFGGYLFWKDAKDFDIRDHIREDRTPMNESDYKRFCGQWMTAPYRKDKPLWEFVCHTEYEKNCSTITLRIHHCLCDGLTLLKMFDVMIGEEPPKFEVKKPQGSSWVKQARLFFQAPLVIGYLYLSNIFHADWFTRHKTSPEGIISWNFLPTEAVKKVRRKLDTHFAIVGMSVVAGALKKHVEEASPDEDLSQKCMNILVPLPWKRHPTDKMANVWTATYIKVPFTYNNCKEWLHGIKDSFIQNMESGAPIFTRYSVPVLTLLPNFVLKPFMNSSYNGFSISFTTVPGRYEDDVFFAGHRVKHMIPMYGLQWRQSAVTSAAFNYKGQTAFCVLANKELFPDRASIDRLVNDFIPQNLQDLLHERQYEKNGNHNVESFASRIMHSERTH